MVLNLLEEIIAEEEAVITLVTILSTVLSPAELEILQLTADGHTKEEIAELRGIHKQTVGRQLAKVRRKIIENLGIQPDTSLY